MTDRYTSWAERALDCQPIDRADARAILEGDQIDLMALVHAAGRVRRKFWSDTVSIHMLDNVRNGACPEDCGYCGQSRVSDAPVQPYKIKGVDAIVEDAKKAKASGAYRFCMALSGRGPNERDIDHMCQAIRQIKAMGLRTCLSAGLLDEDRARRLKDAGLDRFNHNLNPSRRHYPSICTTHTYDDRIATIRTARAAGIGLCSGLIVGMGEGYDDLLDVAYELNDLAAESIPVNFLLPIAGNPINQPRCEDMPLEPQFVLRVLCMMRLVNPAAELRVAAGREIHLRSLQALALWPANSLFIEGYLLTEGDDAAATVRMILDAGFRPALDEGEWPEQVRQMIESPSQPLSPPSTSPSGSTSAATLKPTVSARGSLTR